MAQRIALIGSRGVANRFAFGGGLGDVDRLRPARLPSGLRNILTLQPRIRVPHGINSMPGRRMASTIARIANGGARSHGAAGSSMPRRRLILIGTAAAGLGLVLYQIQQPAAQHKSFPTHLIPLHASARPSRPESRALVANSPVEAPITPISLLRVYIVEPLLTALRFLRLAFIFGPVIIASPMLLVGSNGSGHVGRRFRRHRRDDEENWGAVWWYSFLVKQMERAGPTFIKLGQWAASRADLFPAALCERMSKLHSNGEPHSFHHTKRVIQRAFGMKFDDIFEKFNEQPIGCGAIAQVYKATLNPALFPATEHASDDKAVGDSVPNTSVAIKVLHPRVHQTIRRDIAIMGVFAWFINLFPGMEWISLPEEVAVFGAMMNMQLDLRVESSNLDRFTVNFAHRGQSVRFPRPIRLGHEEGEPQREVMVEEFEDALPLKWFLKNGGGPYDDRIANIGLDAFLNMLLLDNWTHGDLHPGNIMVRFYKKTSRDYFSSVFDFFKPTPAPPTSPIPTVSASSSALVQSLSSIAQDQDEWLDRLESLSAEGYEPQLIFIDAGLVTTLSPDNRRNFLDLFQAVAEFDGYKAGKLMVERCRTPELALDEETFALKMQHLVLSVKSKTFSLAKIKISDILTDVLLAVRQHHVKMEGDFVNTVISILLLEGIGRQLDPGMDLFKSALPILRQVGRQMGSREAMKSVQPGNVWAMAKIWVYLEARQIAESVSQIDEWIKVSLSDANSGKLSIG